MKMQFFNNLEKMDHKNPEHTKNLMQALQFYMSLPDLYIPQLFRGSDALSILFRKTKKKFDFFPQISFMFCTQNGIMFTFKKKKFFSIEAMMA